MKPTEILKKNCVCVPLDASEKTAAITELVDLLAANGELLDRDLTLQAILTREQTRSTGIGLGLAVPHGKSAGCQHLTMAVAKPRQPIPFGAIDNRPCTFVVLLASPIDETGPHIQALASISRLWHDEAFRTAVGAAEDAEALYAAIQQHQG